MEGFDKLSQAGVEMRIRLGRVLAVLALLGVGLAVSALLYARAMRPQIELGVGYAARVACACRFIGGRSLADCRKDFEPGMELIRLSEDAGARSVTASVPLLASRTARLDPLLGCQPERFRGAAHEVKY
jgi:hypothetical protein